MQIETCGCLHLLLSVESETLSLGRSLDPHAPGPKHQPNKGGRGVSDQGRQNGARVSDQTGEKEVVV